MKKCKTAEDQIQILKVTRNALSTVSIHAHVWTAKLQSGLNPSKEEPSALCGNAVRASIWYDLANSTTAMVPMIVNPTVFSNLNGVDPTNNDVVVVRRGQTSEV